MAIEADGYQMRGHLVHPFKKEEIAEIVTRVCSIVGLRRSSFRQGKVEKLVSKLEEYGINVDTVQDNQWIDATRATVDPQAGMIYMPGKLYDDLCRGKVEAIRIFLHELGHIFLFHKPLLHYTDANPGKECDSEWQADLFADLVLERLGLPKADHQLELDFWGY